MLLTIPILMVPSAPITMGITSVFIFHIRCISISRSLYLLFFSISLLDTFLSHGTVMSISLQIRFAVSYYYYLKMSFYLGYVQSSCRESSRNLWQQEGVLLVC